ncbi:hypothetical protein CGRA01v4_03439 [Colletotrichum graminicola]|nr:hypothetical protein CGRA01v4_03439 [Colletotrichum graminicola]
MHVSGRAESHMWRDGGDFVLGSRGEVAAIERIGGPVGALTPSCRLVGPTSMTVKPRRIRYQDRAEMVGLAPDRLADLQVESHDPGLF